MDLWLIRHAAARAPSAWLGDDDSRPLTDEGRRIFAETIQKIRTSGTSPEAVFFSPALRCVETAHLLADSLRNVELHEARWLHLGCPSLLPQVTALTHYRCIALIGHQPDLEAFARTLTGNDHPFHPGAAVLLYLARANE